jgi:hypothetical protein
MNPRKRKLLKMRAAAPALLLKKHQHQLLKSLLQNKPKKLKCVKNARLLKLQPADLVKSLRLKKLHPKINNL